MNKINIYYINPNNPHLNGICDASELENKSIEIAFLGDGVYAFNTLIAARTYLNTVNSKIDIYAIEVVYDDEESLNLDSGTQFNVMCKEFLEIQKNLMSLKCDVVCRSYMDIINLYIQLYKEMNEIRVVEYTLKRRHRLFYLLRHEIPPRLRLAMSNQKVFCVSNDTQMNIIKRTYENG